MSTPMETIGEVFRGAQEQYVTRNPGALDMVQTDAESGDAQLAMEAYFRAFEAIPSFTTTSSAAQSEP